MASIGPVSGMLSFSIIIYLDLGITLAVFLASIGYSAYHYFYSTRLVIGFIHLVTSTLGKVSDPPWESRL